jgi:hypothetical protein
MESGGDSVAANRNVVSTKVDSRIRQRIMADFR